MGWFALFWLTAIFSVFYVALPAFARGLAAQRSWTRRIAESYVTTSFVLQFTILVLGTAGLALPGLVLLVLVGSFALETIRNRRRLLQSSVWRETAVQLLQPSGRARALALLQRKTLAVRAMHREGCLWAILFAAYFFSRAYFAAGNLRFLDSENYSRALSLAVLSSGQPWQIDSSIPLLLPLQILSALPAPAVISFAGPLVSVLFVLAVAFLAFEYARSRYAALLASAFCMVAPTWRGGVAGSELGAAELAAMFIVLGVGLARRSRVCALLAATLAISISASPPFFMTLMTGVLCVALATAVDRVVRYLPREWRSNLRSFATAATLVMLVWSTPSVSADGPHQYEAAARACDEFARKLDRNTWLVVSPSEEVPFLYGRGWHIQLASFAAQFSPTQLADPSFRFTYPVRDVFIFVERKPLRPTAVATIAPDVVGASTATPNQSSVQRASLQFKAARLLAAYQKTHNDLKVVHDTDSLTVYHLPGALALGRH